VYLAFVAAMFRYCSPQFLNMHPYKWAAAALIVSGQALQLCLVHVVAMMMTAMQLHLR